MSADLSFVTPDPTDQEEEELLQSGRPFVLQKMRPRHREVCSLFAQGLKQTDIAAITGFTPVYIGMLLRQPICQQHIAEMSEVAAVRLEAMFGKTVQVINDAMDQGNITEKLKAARLHGELTKRLGARAEIPQPREATEDRLFRLANRLTDLLADAGQRNGGHRNAQQIEDAVWISPSEESGESGIRGRDELGWSPSDEASGDGGRTDLGEAG